MADATTVVAVKFLADASSVENEAAKVEKTGGRFSSWAKGVGGAIAGAFAIDKVKDMVKAGAELEDQIGATGVVFGSAAKDVQGWSKTTAEASGLSQTAALTAANTFATFGKAAGLGSDDLATFSSDLTGLAADLGSFKGTSTEQAIGAVGAALRGEAEPIRAYGVLLDDATLKARAMSMGLVTAAGDSTAIKQAMLNASGAQEKYNKAVKEHGEGSAEAQDANTKLTIAQEKLAKATEGTIPDLTQQQKVLAAEQEIYAQTTDAQGDFARTSDGAANSQKILAAKMEDLQTTIGTALLPVVKTIVPLFQALAGFIQDNATWLIPLVGAIAALVAAYRIFVAIQMAVNAVMALFGVTSAIALGPLILIVVGIAALIAAVFLLWKNWDTIWAWITNAIGVAKDWILGAWSAVVDFFSATWETIKGAFSSAWDFIHGVWDQILGIAQSVLGWIRDNWPLLLAILTGPFGIAVKLILDNWNGILGFFQSLPGTIGGFLSGLGSILLSPFTWAWEQISGIYESIKTGISGAVDHVKTIWNAFARFWNGVEVEVPGVTMPGPIPNIPGFTFGLPDLPMLAAGGIVTKPTLAMLGEKGTEAVVPLSKWPNAAPLEIVRPGPLVVIENATFSDQSDIDLFMARVAWAAQSERV